MRKVEIALAVAMFVPLPRTAAADAPAPSANIVADVFVMAQGIVRRDRRPNGSPAA